MATIEQTTEVGAPANRGGSPGHDPHATATGVTHLKLGMWLFLASDCLFFGAFIATYLLYRGRDIVGPGPKELFDIPFTSATSFILLMSSLTMVLALAAVQRGDLRRLRIWLLATALLGATFIAGQVYEFTQFNREGLSLSKNLYGSTFFVTTGFHGAHVTVGIIWLLSLWGLATQGRLKQKDAERIEIAGLYWHFVDVVWIVIFTVVYLVPQPGEAAPMSDETALAKIDEDAPVEPVEQHGISEHAPGLLPGELRPHPSPVQYVLIAVFLCAVTAIEIAVSYSEGSIPDSLIVVLLLGMAALKFATVAAWYMHLRTDMPIFRRFFILGVVAAIILYTIVLSTLSIFGVMARRGS